jgi:hypothetical protein
MKGRTSRECSSAESYSVINGVVRYGIAVGAVRSHCLDKTWRLTCRKHILTFRFIE